MNRSFDAHLDYALEYVNGIRCHNGKEVESAIQKAEKDLNNYQLKHQKAQADEINIETVSFLYMKTHCALTLSLLIICLFVKMQMSYNIIFNEL